MPASASGSQLKTTSPGLLLGLTVITGIAGYALYASHAWLQASGPQALRGVLDNRCREGYLMAPDPQGLFVDLGSVPDKDWCLRAAMPAKRVHAAFLESFRAVGAGSDGVLRSAMGAAQALQAVGPSQSAHLPLNNSMAQPSLKALPGMELGFEELKDFWRKISELEFETEKAQAEGFNRFHYSEVAKHLASSQDDALPQLLRGVWWVNDHPTHGNVMALSFGFGTSRKGVQAPYMHSPGLAVADDRGNRSSVAWFTRFGLRFYFPKWANSSMTLGAWTDVATDMDPPFRRLPLPAALYEGWKLAEALRWDPKDHPETHQTCFCSLVYGKEEGHIERWNFGKLAYSMYRIVDGSGLPTAQWDRFAKFMDALPSQTITSIVPKAQSGQGAASAPRASAMDDGKRCCCDEQGECHWYSGTQLTSWGGHCPWIIESKLLYDGGDVCVYPYQLKPAWLQVHQLLNSEHRELWGARPTIKTSKCTVRTADFPLGVCDWNQ